jgi:Sulfotransferase family
MQGIESGTSEEERAQEQIHIERISTETNKGEHYSAPIFVVGVWRSGTTLLYALLDQHPDIRLFYESDIPVLWPMFKIPWVRRRWLEKWECWNAGVSRHSLGSIDLMSNTLSLHDAMEWAGRRHAAAAGKKLWGCKSPSYYDRLVDLAREFPQARFIVIWRDPEELCDSVLRAAPSGHWFARPGMAHKALLASRTLKGQCDKLVAFGASLHQIHYRELVEDTSTTMRTICQFLQVPFSRSVTVLEKSNRSAVFKGAHHQLARGSEIVSRRRDNKSLSPALRSKIQRYKSLWKAEFGDNWLLSQRFSSASERPGTWEQAVDTVWFHMLRLWDIAPRLLFSVLPLSVWQAYRKIKYKDTLWLHRQLTDKAAILPSTSHSCSQRVWSRSGSEFISEAGHGDD